MTDHGVAAFARSASELRASRQCDSYRRRRDPAFQGRQSCRNCRRLQSHFWTITHVVRGEQFVRTGPGLIASDPAGPELVCRGPIGTRSEKQQCQSLGLRFLLVVLVFCRGLVLLCVMPPFEGWDEYQHVAYIVHLCETGARPVLGETIVPRSLQARLGDFPHGPYALKTLKATGAVDYASFWREPARVGQKARSLTDSPPLSLYQAQHGSFYYLLAAPLFALAGGVRDLRSSVGALRLLNLVFTVLSVWIALGIVERLIRNRALKALCGLLIAVQPLFLINGVRVANDALGILFATAAIAAALDRHTFRSRGAMFGLGILMGLATLAKSVHFGLIPFVAICALATQLRERFGRPPRRHSLLPLGATLLIFAGFLLTTGAELRATWLATVV